MRLTAARDWACLEFVSDIHLQAADPATAELFFAYLGETRADAVFILGDLFDAWIGDDALDHAPLARRAAQVLRACAASRPVHLMLGNRDFLLGKRFAAEAGVALIPDDALALDVLGEPCVLAHGDALCVADTAYQRFRQQTRSAAWQAGFLAQPYVERLAFASQARIESRAHQASLDHWVDVDATAARALLAEHDACTLIHGHTHRPMDHALGEGLARKVLSDWSATDEPPRAQVLVRNAQGWQRQQL